MISLNIFFNFLFIALRNHKEIKQEITLEYIDGF